MGQDEAAQSRPRDSVFTTVTWDGLHHVADLKAHLNRLSNHAIRLRMTLPENLETEIKKAFTDIVSLKNGQLKQPIGLVKIVIDCTEQSPVRLSERTITLRNEEIEAITVPAPRWNRKVTGTKHGDWAPYHQARLKADSEGSDLALLVHEFSIIDGDRASPILLDEGGLVWYSSSELGGVESITRSIILSKLGEHGFPFQSGNLTERLVARAHEMVALGSGMGACRIITIDGEDIGGSADLLTQICRQILSQHYANSSNWTKMVIE
ncbi:MAG: aminotransferase class IV [Euryarchaeota archaeon]|tara:strand:- start:410 stop:1207 length:798 start_codon:yes stop_codon:yes gene_type:complete